MTHDLRHCYFNRVFVCMFIFISSELHLVLESESPSAVLRVLFLLCHIIGISKKKKKMEDNLIREAGEPG